MCLCHLEEAKTCVSTASQTEASYDLLTHTHTHLHITALYTTQCHVVFLEGQVLTGSQNTKNCCMDKERDDVDVEHVHTHTHTLTITQQYQKKGFYL